MVSPGLFSPIEDVIREAEEQAEREWRIEHEPCPHSQWIDITKLNDRLTHEMCARCGQVRTVA
jgi:hypothetical protein